MTRRVFVIWTHPLFSDGVRLMLGHADVALVGSCHHQQASQAVIEKHHPDVVIMENTGLADEDNSEIMMILQSGPRVIGVSLENNELTIYQRQIQTVMEAGDLLRHVLAEENQD